MNRLWIAILVAALLLAVAIPSTAIAEDDESGASGLIDALDLPHQAHELRRAGVEDEELDKALQVLRERPEPQDDDSATGRRASEATQTLRAEAETAKEHGPLDNFGDFIRTEVESGKKGPELAESIRDQRDDRRPKAAQQRAGTEDRARGAEEAKEGRAPSARERAGDRRDDEKRGATEDRPADRPARPQRGSEREKAGDSQPDRRPDDKEAEDEAPAGSGSDRPASQRRKNR